MLKREKALIQALESVEKFSIEHSELLYEAAQLIQEKSNSRHDARKEYTWKDRAQQWLKKAGFPAAKPKTPVVIGEATKSPR